MFLLVSQYGVGTATVNSAMYTISNPPVGQLVTYGGQNKYVVFDYVIRDTLSGILAANPTAFGALNANTLLAIHVSKDINISKGSSSGTTYRHCIAFCAYHSTLNVTIGSSFYSIPYSVLPDLSQDGCLCGLNTVDENMKVAMAHELAETATEPIVDDMDNGISWHRDSDQFEVVDLCVNQRGKFALNGVTYPVPGLWSNNAGACVFSAP
jgi:hypothetical protein